jgi:hypothetical protein
MFIVAGAWGGSGRPRGLDGTLVKVLGFKILGGVAGLYLAANM